jgi:hypothetical protein
MFAILDWFQRPFTSTQYEIMKLRSTERLRFVGILFAAEGYGAFKHHINRT